MHVQLTTTSGLRKGNITAWKSMLSSVADKTLRIFPVPGLDVFLAKGFNPHQKGIAIAATPRHANVLLVTSPLPATLLTCAANVYAQMPRPRLLVFVATNHVAPLPASHLVLSVDEINLLHQKISFQRSWAEDAFPYQVPSVENEDERIYACPMHPEVQSDKPGKCPKCGMFLVKKEPEQESTNMAANKNEKQHNHQHMPGSSLNEGKTLYTCPMHPEVQSDKPGKCPKCGMTLVEKDSGEHRMNVSPDDKHQHAEKMQSDSAEELKSPYTCPMHPEVQSDKPGKCRKCGMTLVKQEHKEHKMDMSGGHQHETNGHEHEGHKDMGFMSMVQMTKDMPRSEDGLAMEMNDAFFGPFHPGLPGGLLVKMRLDGDSVVKANCEKGILSQHLLHNFPKEPANLANYLSQLNPLLHHTYSILVARAIQSAGCSVNFTDEVSLLEKDRIASHLNWLSVFSSTIGNRRLQYEASKMCFQLQSKQADKRTILNLITRVKKTPYLKKRLSSLCIIPDDFIKQISGPLARAAGMELDVRTHSSSYLQTNFTPMVICENNAWGQLLVRLAEIDESVELTGEGNLNKEMVHPEIVIRNLAGEQNGEAVLEAPNGRLHLKIKLKDGQVTSLSLQTASMTHAALIPEVTKGKELADALVSIAALDICPWEMDM